MDQKSWLICRIKAFFWLKQEIVSILDLNTKKLEPSPLFLNEIQLDRGEQRIATGRAYHNETYFSPIHSLPAASNLVLNNGILKGILDIPQFLSMKQRKAKFRGLFLDGIRCTCAVMWKLADTWAVVWTAQPLHPCHDRISRFRIFEDFHGLLRRRNEVDERPWAMVVNAYPVLKPHFMKPGCGTNCFVLWAHFEIMRMFR